MKYRKKPVVIEALRFLGGFSVDEMGVEWGKDFTDVASYSEEMNNLVIDTLEGGMTAQYGDFIIRGVNGEFYPCKPDIFAKTYEDIDGQCVQAASVESGDK